MDTFASPWAISWSNKRSQICEWNWRKSDRRLIFPYTTLDYNSKKLLEELPSVFSDQRKKKEKDSEELQSELYKQIGQLKVEVDWLKKKSEQLS